MFPLQGEAFKPTLELLSEFDPDAANSLKNIARLSKADFEAMLRLEDCEGMSKENYVQHSVAAALCMGGDTAWIYENFRDGFWASLSLDVLRNLSVSPEELMEMVCGAEGPQGSNSTQFSVQQVRYVSLKTASARATLSFLSRRGYRHIQLKARAVVRCSGSF